MPAAPISAIAPSDSVGVASAPRFVRGMDSMRLVAAIWVIFSHGARFPVEAVIDPSAGKLQLALYALSKMAFNGVAAVALFFIISGFCIHYPNIEKKTLAWKSFLIKRIIRIGIPLGVVVLIARLAGADYVESEDMVLWTIYCEIIYYCIYPILFRIIKKFGLVKTLAVSSVFSLAIVAVDHTAINLWEFRHVTWLFCLPLWLIGALAAESFKRGRSENWLGKPLWPWRLGALGYCVFSTVVAYHVPGIAVGYTWTIIPFGVYCHFWLLREIANFHNQRFNVMLERIGVISYSLYLIHKLVITFFEKHVAMNPTVLSWAALLTAIGACSFAYYSLVERPSHNLARSLGARTSAKPVAEA